MFPWKIWSPEVQCRLRWIISYWQIKHWGFCYVSTCANSRPTITAYSRSVFIELSTCWRAAVCNEATRNRIRSAIYLMHASELLCILLVCCINALVDIFRNSVSSLWILKAAICKTVLAWQLGLNLLKWTLGTFLNYRVHCKAHLKSPPVKKTKIYQTKLMELSMWHKHSMKILPPSWSLWQYIQRRFFHSYFSHKTSQTFLQQNLNGTKIW